MKCKSLHNAELTASAMYPSGAFSLAFLLVV
jgi:hypothetical protein